MDTKEANAERDNARQPYLLSLQLPLRLLLLVVLMWSKPGQKILSLPAAVFSNFRSQYAFVRWHALQWTLLTAVAALLVLRSNALADTFSGSAGWWLIGLAGWYVGNAVGLWQANRGRCWLWKWFVQDAELPRPWAVLSPASAPSIASAEKSTSSIALADSPLAVPDQPRLAFEKGRELATAGRKAEAVARLLFAFRSGPPELRQRAAAELERLGEVETF